LFFNKLICISNIDSINNSGSTLLDIIYYFKHTDKSINKTGDDAIQKKKNVFPPGIEPGTFRVLGGCDNHYTTETVMNCFDQRVSQGRIRSIKNLNNKYFLQNNDTTHQNCELQLPFFIV
jgi:hypothetical protein